MARGVRDEQTYLAVRQREKVTVIASRLCARSIVDRKAPAGQIRHRRRQHRALQFAHLLLFTPEPIVGGFELMGEPALAFKSTSDSRQRQRYGEVDPNSMPVFHARIGSVLYFWPFGWVDLHRQQRPF